MPKGPSTGPVGLAFLLLCERWGCNDRWRCHGADDLSMPGLPRSWVNARRKRGPPGAVRCDRLEIDGCQGHGATDAGALAWGPS